MSDPDKLLSAYRRLDRVFDFSPGQIVMWKPGLKNRAEPGLGEPLVVLEQLDEPFTDDTATSGCAASWERLDIIGGWLDDDEQLLVGCFDRRRLQPRIIIEDASEDD